MPATFFRARLVRFVVLAGVLGIVLAACSSDSPTQTSSSPPAAGGETLDFTAERLGGGSIQGSDLAGAPVAMWFWAPW